MMVLLDDVLIDADEASVPINDRGLLLGDGLFETFLIRNGSPTRFEQHMVRMAEGCDILGMEAPYRPDQIKEQIERLTNANDIIDGTARLTLTRGSGPRGVLPPKTPNPRLMITTGPAPPEPGPAKVIVATVTRRNERSPLSRVKCLNYLDNILARQEAQRRGADDALMLNTAGRVACSTIANIFIHLDGGWMTPPTSEGALPGVARAEFMSKREVDMVPISIAMVRQARKVLLTNALGKREIVEIMG